MAYYVSISSFIQVLLLLGIFPLDTCIPSDWLYARLSNFSSQPRPLLGPLDLCGQVLREKHFKFCLFKTDNPLPTTMPPPCKTESFASIPSLSIQHHYQSKKLSTCSIANPLLSVNFNTKYFICLLFQIQCSHHISSHHNLKQLNYCNSLTALPKSINLFSTLQLLCSLQNANLIIAIISSHTLSSKIVNGLLMLLE